MSASPLLSAKLLLPPRRRASVERPLLHDRLSGALSRMLTLVCAPAGFGKSTLVSEWAASLDRPVSWLSLETDDADIASFFTYLVAALARLAPAAFEAVRTSGPPTPPAIANALADLKDPAVLILDDYHLTEGAADETVSFLLAHFPPSMHMVIITRTDPGLPLARLRARGELTEIREADLRFTPEEADRFLSGTMGVELPPEARATLAERTEGWAAGLQLAALAVDGSGAAAVDAFNGSHRYVVDYLLEETLAHRSEELRTFLLQTSVLTRFCEPLCAAVTESPRTRALLDRLEQANLFLVPLDEQREWYRYHHLFAEALRTELSRRNSAGEPELHRRACDWYWSRGMTAEAVHHALAARDTDRAVTILERIWPEMDEHYQSDRWLGWMRSIPPEAIGQRPLLSMGYAWALLNRGELPAAEKWLERTERLALKTGVDFSPDDRILFRTLPGAIAAARAYRALTECDSDAAMEHAQHALRLPSDAREASHRQGRALMGVAYWARGELATADEVLTDFMHRMLATRNFTDAMIAFVLAEIRVTLGRVSDARSACMELLTVASREPTPMALVMGDIYRALAEVALERWESEDAQNHFQRALDLRDHVTLPNWEFRLLQTQSHLVSAAGAHEQALDLLTEADAHYTPAPLPLARSVGAQAAQLNLRLGRQDDAERWLESSSLPIDRAAGYLSEYAQLTAARVLIARGATEAANGLLEKLQQAAEVGGRNGSVIEILLARAVSTREPGPLHAALLRAQTEGIARPFVEEGATLLPELRDARDHGIARGFTSRLITILEQPQEAATQGHGLAEPLSEREREVLAMLGTELSGPQIAGELIISLNTLRTHTKSIYGKLSVGSRRSAVRRASELGLL